MSRVIRPLVFLAADLGGSKIGGIQSFVRGFVKFAPPDFAIECVGTTTDPQSRPVGRWMALDVDGRSVRYFAVMRTPPGDRRSRVPVLLRYTAALVRHRRPIRLEGRVLNYHRAAIALVHLRDRVPKVQFVHLNVDDIYAQRGESRWRWLPGAYHRVEDLTSPQMDRVFVVTERGVGFYRRRHPSIADRVTFLPTWYDDTIFPAADGGGADAIRAEFRESLGLHPDTPVALFVGRLEAQKDPELVVDAFAEAHARDERLRLVVVGSGGLEQRTRDRATSRGVAAAVHFLGPRPREEVARFMLAGDLLVLASRFEGMPITAIEALASGLPIVAPDVGELPRLVQSGSTGWLVHERTAAAIADGIHRVLAMPADATAERCRSLASQYRPMTVLAPVYELHRELSARGATETPEPRALVR